MNPKRPLIFVPGIRTSRLAIKKDNGYLEHFWPLMPHEFFIRDKLDRVFQYLETKIRLKADDDVPVVATSLVPMAYDGLVREILAWGYKPNTNFWIFPYDLTVFLVSYWQDSLKKKLKANMTMALTSLTIQWEGLLHV